MEPIRCYTCGFPLGDKYNLFIYLRQIYITRAMKESGREIPINNQPLDYELNVKLESIFKFLNLNNYCCRTVLLTIWKPEI
ncbi:MAG: hypothetical protein QW303_00580 [Nitrososphaerota archaeon]